MKKLFLAIFAALLCVTARGEIIVYKHTYTITRTGGSATSKIKVTGWTLFDTNGGFCIIKENFLAKKFNVEFPVATVSDIHGALAKTFSIVQVETGEISGGMNIKGTDVLANPEGVPTSLVISGLDTYEIEGIPSRFLDEYKGAMRIDKINMASFNVSNYTIGQAVDVIRASLITKGETEQDTF